MGVIGVILLVIFVIVCLILIALVLLQNSEGGGLGGLLSGGSNSAFGSRSASVLTKITYGAVGLFFVTAFFLAFLNKSPTDEGFEEEVQRLRSDDTEWWDDSASAAPATDSGDSDASVLNADAPSAETAAGDAAVSE